MQGSAEITWDGCLVVECLARHGMMKCQTEGMQTHAATGVFLSAVFAVTYDGMANVCHVDTDLVFTTR